MTSEINITVGQARGLLKVAANNDVRYYLNAICAQPEHGRAVATDGHIMLMTPSNGSGGSEFIIPREVLQDAVKKPRDRDELCITCDGLAGEIRRYDYRDGSKVTLEFKAVDGRFPTIDRVIPDTFDGEPANYNPELVYRLSQGIEFCVKGAGHEPKVAQLFSNGLRAGLLCDTAYSELAIGIVMPMRVDKVENPRILVDEFAANIANNGLTAAAS